MKYNLLELSILCLSLLCCVFYTGCANSGYQKTTVTKQGVTFSFEYPRYFKDEGNTIKVNSGAPFDVVFIIPTEILNEGEDENAFYISVIPLKGIGSLPYKNAQDMIDTNINNWLELSKSQEFNLLQRSPIEVSGIIGELVVFSGKSLLLGENIQSVAHIFQTVYIDYKDNILEIGMMFHPDMKTELVEEYHHILQSFEIIK